MRLLHLEVWSWRGLEHEALPQLAPDLNLVVGPNESGKSRLFEALRYGLFERYKGESEDKRRLKTWGSSESPEVRVDFEIGGRAFSLTKRFLRGARAKLTGPGTNLSDEDAEEKLRSLWGTQEIKGRTEPERFLGLWPLLWVQQGRAGLAPHADLNADTRTRLSEALAREVHEVAAGRVGQRIAERAEVERTRYWTLGGKEREELLAAQKRLSAATAAFELKSSRRRAAHAASDDLSRTLERIAELEGKVATQRGEVTRALGKASRADERARALATRELDAQRLHADRELVRQRARERAQLEAEVASLREEVARWRSSRRRPTATRPGARRRAPRRRRRSRRSPAPKARSRERRRTRGAPPGRRSSRSPTGGSRRRSVTRRGSPRSKPSSARCRRRRR
jgi:DNA repair exonuclease SbcCD ATPase subunit